MHFKAKRTGEEDIPNKRTTSAKPPISVKSKEHHQYILDFVVRLFYFPNMDKTYGGSSRSGASFCILFLKLSFDIHIISIRITSINFVFIDLAIHSIIKSQNFVAASILILNIYNKYNSRSILYQKTSENYVLIFSYNSEQFYETIKMLFHSELNDSFNLQFTCLNSLLSNSLLFFSTSKTF